MFEGIVIALIFIGFVFCCVGAISENTVLVLSGMILIVMSFSITESHKNDLESEQSGPEQKEIYLQDGTHWDCTKQE